MDLNEFAFLFSVTIRLRDDMSIYWLQLLLLELDPEIVCFFVDGNNVIFALQINLRKIPLYLYHFNREKILS